MISLAATLQLVPGFSGLQPGVLACIVEYVGKIFKLQTVKKKKKDLSVLQEHAILQFLKTFPLIAKLGHSPLQG